jgi:HEAT repeats/PBS lyase HEAT-like repeat
MLRQSLAAFSVAVALFPAEAGGRLARPQSDHRSVRDLIADLSAADPTARTRAACGLREHGDGAGDAIGPLTKLLADGSPVDARVCARRWWRGSDDLTTPGEQAAAALVSLGSSAFAPVLSALKHEAWIARKNAAWTLGAMDDHRAVGALADALRDREAAVREQAAWALGAIDDKSAVPALMAALKDDAPGVRKQAAWALGAIDDSRAVDALMGALSDQQPEVREQAAWALGALGDSRALNGLLVALKDTSAGVRRQAAWALGAIGR